MTRLIGVAKYEIRNTDGGVEMQNNKWLQALIVLLVIIASAWLVGQAWGFILQFSNILLLFFLSWLLAFILRPVARWLTHRGLPYVGSVAIVYLVLAFAIILGGFLLVPLITNQIEQLQANLGVYTATIEDLINGGQKTLENLGVKPSDLNRISQDLVNQAQSALLAIIQNTFSILQSVATLLLQLLFILFVSFYIMKDGDRLSAGILKVLPPRWGDEVRLAALSIEKSFGGFIRGQVVFALVYGVLTAIIMMTPPFQLDYVVLASIVAGLFMLLPIIGGTVAYIPPLLVCIVTPEKAGLWGLLLLVIFVMQSLMINILSPRIMSSAIGLHPIYVVAALLVGAQVAGLWGAIFGIPLAGALNLIGRPLFRRIRHQMPLYQEIGSHSLPTSAFLTGPLAAQMMQQTHHTQALPSDILTEDATQGLPVPPPQTPHIPQVPQPAQFPHTALEAAMNSRAALAEAEQDADLIVRRSPTLSARAWRLVIILGSRAVNWAWTRARRQASGTGR